MVKGPPIFVIHQLAYSETQQGMYVSCFWRAGSDDDDGGDIGKDNHGE